MSQSNENKSVVRIIGCRVFKPALDYLGLESKYPSLRLTYLPPSLHLKPQELGKYLRREVTLAQVRNERIICLYGECFPGIDEYCQRRGVARVPGPHCWEMLLGSKRFRRLMEETSGTYFLEKELILNFEEYCIEPLELYDEEMREHCFKHYRRLVYVRQPSDPNLVTKAAELAEFLGLSLEIQDADYLHLEKRLAKLLRSDSQVNLNVLQKHVQEENKRAAKLHLPKKRKATYVWLNVQPEDIWLKVRRGHTLRKALQDGEVKVEGDCGGLGKCGKCKVKILSQLDPPSENERELLDEDELEKGIRLACRTEVDRDLAISVGEPGEEVEYFQILTTSHVLTDRYIPISELDPLVDKKLVTLSPDIEYEWLSNLDRIKLTMGSEHRDLSASLHCLRTLPQKLAESNFHGTIVLHRDRLLAWQNWEEVYRHYGLVFDIGTSTLVGKLLSLVDGSEVAVASCLNSQSRFGSDIISRLQYARENRRGLQMLNYLLARDLNQLTAHLLNAIGLKAHDVFIAIVAGNTSMQHFLLGLSPLGIAEAPFAPVLTDGLMVKAADVGLRLHPEALCYVMPVESGYIGGDLISVVLASGVAQQQELILGLDLGTNGEVFLGNSNRLLTCSAAAGPALEGGRISCGMIAKAGAIEGVSFEEGQLHYRVIGNIKPKGICGSGLVDLVAVLLRCGVIDPEGVICPPLKKPFKELGSRVINRSGVYDFLLASPEDSHNQKPMYLTQKDVREVQLAKGAIAAGVNTLMDELGIGVQDISHVYVAGALGNYIDPWSAVRIGLLPGTRPEIVSSLGNAASMGASIALLSKKHWQMARDLADFIEHIELSCRIDFNQYFVEHIDFPVENMW